MKHRAIFSGFAILMALAVGCTGELTPFDPLGGGVDPGPVDPVAEQMFTMEVVPILNVQRARGACSLCHQADLQGPGPDFMGLNAAENFRSVLAFPNLVIPGNPQGSRLQNYGPHTGDAMLPNEVEIVSNWILTL